jgi:hypothetical protein
MSDLGASLPQGVRVQVFHGLQDETAPPSHADLYALAIPQARVRKLPGREQQLNNDLTEVAEALCINWAKACHPHVEPAPPEHQKPSGPARCCGIVMRKRSSADPRAGSS